MKFVKFEGAPRNGGTTLFANSRNNMFILAAGPLALAQLQMGTFTAIILDNFKHENNFRKKTTCISEPGWHPRSRPGSKSLESRAVGGAHAS